MRLVDFVIFLLLTHAETLKRLAALLGEDELLNVLESAGENAELDDFQLQGKWFQPSTANGGSSAYAELEGSIHELSLPAVLEFHLWAYPFYRVLVESGVDLDAKIHSQSIDHLIAEAMKQAQAWVRTLPLPPELSQQAERVAHSPWIRFRAQVLKKAGKTPVSPLPPSS